MATARRLPRLCNGTTRWVSDQLAVNRVLLDVRIIERGQIEQRIAEFFGSKTRQLEKGRFFRADHLFDQRGLLGGRQGKQRLGLGFPESTGLYQCTSKTAKR
jgi:hypothetical protein